jgi:hypothetical protein
MFKAVPFFVVQPELHGPVSYVCIGVGMRDRARHGYVTAADIELTGGNSKTHTYLRLLDRRSVKVTSDDYRQGTNGSSCC